MLKLLRALLFFFMVSAVSAQGIVIGYPPAGTSVKAGHDVRVQLDKPDSLSSSLEIGVGIAIASCAAGPCRLPQDFMGDVLYHGAFNPVQTSEHNTTLSQTFFVKVPSSFPTGPAQLNIAHDNLIGAGFIPYMQALNISLIVV